MKTKDDTLLSLKEATFERDKDGELQPSLIPIDLRDERIEKDIAEHEKFLEYLKSNRNKAELENDIVQEVEYINALKKAWNESGEEKTIYAIPLLPSEVLYMNMRFKDNEGKSYVLDGDGKRIKRHDEKEEQGVDYSEAPTQDDWMINHCVINPKFTYNDLKYVKDYIKNAIIKSLEIVSGYSREGVYEKARRYVSEVDEKWLALKSKKEAKLSFLDFLATRGYRVFDIGKLSNKEREELIDSFNKMRKKKVTY